MKLLVPNRSFHLDVPYWILASVCSIERSTLHTARVCKRHDSHPTTAYIGNIKIQLFEYKKKKNCCILGSCHDTRFHQQVADVRLVYEKLSRGKKKKKGL